MKLKLYLFFLLLSTVVFAQQKRITTTVDSTKVKIGSQISLTLKTTVDTLSRVVFPEGNFFGSLEVLESYPTDTLKKDYRYQLIKKYGLTQWDSGAYVLPRLEIRINDKTHYSDSLLIEFTPVAVDTLKQHLYDIKEIAEAPFSNSHWLLYVLVFLGALGLAYLGYRHVKKNQKEKTEEVVYATPIEKATAHLKKLEQQHLIERGEIKTYYSELTNIARTYIEETIEIPALESTTSELITAFKGAIVKKKLSLNAETITHLEKVLQQADLVKFAKSKPLEFEIANDRTNIEKTILTIQQSLPEIEEEQEELDNPQTRLDRAAKKKRKQQIVLASFFSVFVLVGVLVFFTATKGIDYVKDSVFGNPSKALLNSEWVTSEYGNPPIRITTPKVLTRLRDTTAFALKAMGDKEAIQFGYGNLADGLSITLTTTKSKDTTQVSLEKIAESNLVNWEKNGAQNILVKTETFSSPEGLNGIRAYGTMDFLDKSSKRSYKLYYEMLLFKKDKGIQQILVSKREADALGSEVLDRIIKSVALGKTE